MRHSRPVATDEKWDLGVLLFFFFVSFLCLTVLWRTQAVPRLWAFAFQAPSQTSPDSVITLQPPPASAEMLQHLAQVPALPNIAPPTPPPASVLPHARAVKPAVKAAVPNADVATRWYNGQQYRYQKTLTMRVTAYAPDPRCCWPYPGTTTASGKSVTTNKGRLVAADTRVLPFYSLVSVPGYHSGELVPVLDRGGAIKGNRLDVLLPSYEQAKNWGSRSISVKIYMPVNKKK